MNKQNILVFNLTTRSGMLHYSSQFVNALKQKFNVGVYVAGYYKLSLYEDGVKLFKIRTNPSLFDFIIDTLMFWNQIILIYNVIKFKPTIIHFIDNHPWYLLYARLFKLLGYKIYVTQHNPIQHSGENTGLQGRVELLVNKMFRKLSTKIIVNGDVLKSDLVLKYGVDNQKIISVPHGDYTFLSKWGKGNKPVKNCFIFFGRIKDYKGLDILLESLVYVKEKISDFKLIIAGNGSLDKYFRIINKYKNNIDIYNFEIKDEDIYKYFEKSEFAVLPYKDATASGVVQVAYGFSKPVIVTNVGELSSVVEEGITGLILSPNDPKQLGEKIIWMLENKELVVEMGQNAYKYTLQEFGWDKIVSKIYN